MNVKLAETDDEIRACFPVMAELRPRVLPEAFLARVRAQERQGYRLAFLADGGAPVAVAGFRVLENLAWGRFLYVDDLVTLASCRSRGYGAALLGWLRETARRGGCAELHLDSGIQRRDAHRFYAREGLDLASHHFRWVVEGGPADPVG